MTMTDAEVSAMIDRADRFREAVRAAISGTVVEPDSPCADAARRGLDRIASTLDEVDYVMITNLSNLDAAMIRRTGSGLMPLIELRLMATGAGPSLDFKNAAAFLAAFEPLVEMARRRRIN